MLHGRFNFLLIVALAFGTLIGRSPALASAQSDSPAHSQETAIGQAFDAHDYTTAARLIEAYLKQWPDQPAMLYNHACACAQLKRIDDATSSLFQAVQAGFNNFPHMRSDPHLKPIHHTEMYQAILEAADRLDDAPAQTAMDRWIQAFGREGYRFERDDDRRLMFATALDETAHTQMRTMIQKQADHLIATLFERPPAYSVLIAVPTAKDARQIFNGDDDIGGKYEHNTRRLIARDIGGTLRHEFVHALHYAHMEQLGLTKPHPLWIQEGLATLYEDYTLDDKGAVTYLPNERDSVVKNLERMGLLTKWEKLLTMSDKQFMRRPGKTYPQVRVIFEYLADQGKLSAWYHAYLEDAEKDPTGRMTFERIFDEKLADIERRWRVWVRSRTIVDTNIKYGDPSLGVICAINGSTDGVLVSEILPGSGAAMTRLRAGDVIVSIDGQPTRSLSELRRIVAAKRIGDRVNVRFRRGKQYVTTKITLKPLKGGSA